MNSTIDQTSMYDSFLPQNTANYVPLTPLSFIDRTAAIYPNKIALVHGNRRLTWAETYQRSRQLADALVKAGVQPNDTVSIMASNIPAMFEAHFGVPMAGAVLNTLNIRLDAESLAFMMEHAATKVLLTDKEFSPVVSKALTMIEHTILVIDIDDELAESGELIGKTEYEDFIASGDPDFKWSYPKDEWQAISLNYTSGTTGNPKGVVYHHRGANLNAVNNILTWSMPMHSVYLWTLPMFHCNGWCFPWTLAAIAGTSVCLRKIKADTMYNLIADEKVTHFSGAPIILSTLLNAPDHEKRTFPQKVNGMVAGAAPPAKIIEGMEKAGFDITHVYGLTECYGPTVFCAWQDEWDSLPIEEKSELKARQGVKSVYLNDLQVLNPDTMQPVPKDGKTMGEIFMRGNNVMKGYLKNPQATMESFQNGWFHTGDLAVVHPDGYVKIQDRSKDIIISGGENISTIEVEGVLYRFDGIIEAACVAKPDEKWGETVCAFVTMKPGVTATAEEIIAHCKSQLAGFKVPKNVVFMDLPKTSTGKVQKYTLREIAAKL